TRRFVALVAILPWAKTTNMVLVTTTERCRSKNPYQAPGPVGRGRPPLSAPPHPPPPPPSYGGGYEHPAYNPL
ncbi:hypothetical protein ANCDUO_25090, partial [Ancylostoma duodenale]